MTEFLYSSKYFNEMGSYQPCQFESPQMNYAIALLHDNPYSYFDKKLLWAICAPVNCSKDSL